MALPTRTPSVLPHSNRTTNSAFRHPTVIAEVKAQPSSNRRGTVSRMDSNPLKHGSNTSKWVPPTTVELAAHTRLQAALERQVPHRDNKDSHNMGRLASTVPGLTPSRLPVPIPIPHHANRLDQLVQTQHSSEALLQPLVKYE